MLFGSTSRRFGTISIFPSIPIATYRIMHILRKVVRAQMPGESACRNRRGRHEGSMNDVRFVPKADIAALFDYLVRNSEYARRNGQAEPPSSSNVDDELELGGLLYRQIGRLGTPQYLVHITSSTPIQFRIFRPVGQ